MTVVVAGKGTGTTATWLESHMNHGANEVIQSPAHAWLLLKVLGRALGMH